MSMHDKTLAFFFKTALAKTAGTSLTSKLIDLRLNGEDIDGRLFVYAALNAAISAGVVTVKLQTSADGSEWTDLIAKDVSSGSVLLSERLPLGTKRYLKMTVAVKEGTGSEGADVNLDAAKTVFAELTDTVDKDYPVDVQGVSSGKPADIAAAGDAVRAAVEAPAS